MRYHCNWCGDDFAEPLSAYGQATCPGCGRHGYIINRQPEPQPVRTSTIPNDMTDAEIDSEGLAMREREARGRF